MREEVRERREKGSGEGGRKNEGGVRRKGERREEKGRGEENLTTHCSKNHFIAALPRMNV